ncbi:MAG: hypothetical protein ABIE70_04520 [bacterium]
MKPIKAPPPRRRRVIKWLMTFAGVWVLLAVLQVSALAYPQPWFEYRADVEPFAIYSDRAIDQATLTALRDLPDILAQAGLTAPQVNHDVFICNDLWRFDLFRRLTLLRGDLLGFGLSLFDNAYINMSKIDRHAESFDGYIDHTALQGDFVQVIAHEIAHGWLQENIGFWRLQHLPSWKNEGFAEYASNIAHIRADTMATLTSRLDKLNNDFYWGGGESYARWRYRAQLTVEYLLEVEGMPLEELLDDSLTLDPSFQRMTSWATCSNRYDLP